MAETCQSLAYGDVLNCTGAQASALHFTGKMRDAETNLTEFPARYYSPAQGRWYSPDWASAQVPVPYADLHNPQTLNLYDYVGSDPTNHADADGHSGGGSGPSTCDGANASCSAQGTAQAGKVEGQTAAAQTTTDQNTSSAAAAPAVPLAACASGGCEAAAAGVSAADAAASLVLLPAAAMGAAILLPPMEQGDPMTPGYVPAPPVTGTPASTSQQGAVDTSPMAAKDKGQEKEHTSNQQTKNWDKHTKPRPGRSNTKDRQKPGFKPRTPPRPQDMDSN